MPAVKDPKKLELFSKIWDEAHAAGMKAGLGSKPNPMIVQEHENMLDDNSPVRQEWFVSEGVCGFAWVVVYPGNAGFARWAKDVKGGSAEYGGGMCVKWVGEFNQSMDRKEAYAHAFTEVLRSYGIKAHSKSRMD